MYTALETAPAGYVRVILKHGPYSASKLHVARCPARFQGKFILKDHTVSDNMNSARGSAIHHVLQKIDEARVSGSAMDVTAWVAEAMGLYPSAYAQVDLVKRAAAAYVGNPCKYLNETTKCENSFAVALYTEDTFLDDVVPGRAYVKMPVPDDGTRVADPDVFFSGKADIISIDELTKTVTIIDHKSTPNASVNQDTVFQMGCYAWLISTFYPGYKIRTVIHYANPDLNFYSPPQEWDPEDLAEYEEEIRARVFSIEAFKEYPALPSSQCDYCHMSQLCPTFIAVSEQNAKGPINLNINTPEDLKNTAEKLRVLGLVYDRVNGALKEGLEKLNMTSIAIDGMVYGFRKGDAKVDWDSTEDNIKLEARRADSLIEQGEGTPELLFIAHHPTLDSILSAHQLDPNTFKTWKGDRLKAIFKLDKPELLKTIQKYAVYDSGTRFGGYKA